MATLKVNGLSIRFGGIKALSNVGFEVPPRAFVGLMGPNGAGKTTVINCISRIYQPESGEMVFDGHDLLKLSGNDILALGIARTFQDLSFFNRISNMRIIDYLKLGQFSTGSRSLFFDGLRTGRSRNQEHDLKKKARRVLEFFRDMRDRLEAPEKERGYPYLFGREGFPDLIDVEYKPISTLSFAWRRRLDLARALSSNPKLLLLDEPAQGLPPSEIENLGKTLKLIQSEMGVSALIVEHNVATLSEISDRIVMMNLGEKITEGHPDEVNADPRVIEVYLGGSASESKQQGPTMVEEKKFEIEAVPLLEVRNIDLFYGSAQALSAVSLKIPRGQITVVLGTNGSGKSTLLKAIAGVEKPDVGEILFKGESVPLGWPEAVVDRGVQYVPQGHVIFPQLSVRDNLKIGTYSMKRKDFDFEIALEKIVSYFPQLKQYINLQAASLSGGQQQMLAIGQALIREPELLLLDEPSLGLSPILVEVLFETIQEINRVEKCAVMLVEQNARKAIAISDYVYMMSSGMLIGEGPGKLFMNNTDIVKRNLGFY